jgi:hypothetical protein
LPKSGTFETSPRSTTAETIGPAAGGSGYARAIERPAAHWPGAQAWPGQIGDAVVSPRSNQSGDGNCHLVCRRCRALRRRGGIFLLAACLVGLAALFRWIEIRYGLFHAFGAVGGLLVVIAAICAALAARKLKHPPPHFPSLASRLRVAIKAGPLAPDQIESARDTAEAILLAPSPPVTRANRRRPKTSPRSARDNRDLRAGLLLMVTLLGWVAARRRRLAQRSES